MVRLPTLVVSTMLVSWFLTHRVLALIGRLFRLGGSQRPKQSPEARA